MWIQHLTQRHLKSQKTILKAASLSDNETSKEITVKIYGKDNFEQDETNEIVTSYNIIRKTDNTIDLSKAKIVAKEKDAKGRDVPVKACEYTGTFIIPEIRDLIYLIYLHRESLKYNAIDL